MLCSARLQTIVCTARPAEAGQFYGNALRARGLTWERFAHFPHDADGVLEAPDGSRVVWFRDPDGNLLSIVQYPNEGK